MINVEQTIISQYSTSSTIGQLIANMNDYIDPRADIDNFYDFVWNVQTAQGFGLDIWGRIVNIGRLLKIPTTPLYFGFNEQANSTYPFNDEPFYDGIPPVTQNYILQDEAYRQLILVKALANISAANARSLNQLLQNLFINRGRAYVNDLGNMTMRFTFEFIPTPFELAIIIQSGALLRPAGVLTTLLAFGPPVFGFSEAGAFMTPFNDAPFITEGSLHAII